jgi:hypothetical protein
MRAFCPATSKDDLAKSLKLRAVALRARVMWGKARKLRATASPGLPQPDPLRRTPGKNRLHAARFDCAARSIDGGRILFFTYYSIC